MTGFFTRQVKFNMFLARIAQLQVLDASLRSVRQNRRVKMTAGEGIRRYALLQE